MMRRIPWLVLLAAAMPATAQQVDIATDQELHSAYCLAAINLSAAENRAVRTAEIDRRENAQMSRFRSYLTSRGLFAAPIIRSRIAIQGINVAAEQAKADTLVCARRDHACFNQCRDAKPLNELMACATACRETVSQCIKLDHCWDADQNIPF